MKSVTLKRVTFALVLTIVSICTYLLNMSYLNESLRYFVKPSLDPDREIWKKFGVDTECRKFIRPDPAGIPIDDVQAYRSNLLIARPHSEEDLRIRSVKFNINESDVLVVMHIQKTGGTYLEAKLIHDIVIQPPVSCSNNPKIWPGRTTCQCFNDKGQDWLFSRPCTGWACGVHAGFNELTSCVDLWYASQPNETRTRRYHYITLLRDPVTRFFSEWLHVRRGATWKEEQLFCDGREASLEEVPFCFKSGTWENVTFDEFMNCSSNLAFNRQTRMMANVSLSDCYRLHSNLTRNERDEIMLQSAKNNLAKFFAFFGLVEYLAESQTLFEKTFLGLKFKTSNSLELKQRSAGSTYALMSEHLWNRIVEANLLDVRLYQYAKDLFLLRLKKAKIKVDRPKNEARIVHEDFRYVYEYK